MALSLPSLLPPVYSLLFLLPPYTPYTPCLLSLSTLSPPPLPSQLLQREYGDYLVTPESSYDISVQFDYESLPENKGRHPSLSHQSAKHGSITYSWLCRKYYNPSLSPILVTHMHTLWLHYETWDVYSNKLSWSNLITGRSSYCPVFDNAHTVSGQKLDGGQV